MNTDPEVRFNGTKHNPISPGCGRQGMANRATAFWQSRHPNHKQTPLADIPALARAIRRTWPS